MRIASPSLRPSRSSSAGADRRAPMRRRARPAPSPSACAGAERHRAVKRIGAIDRLDLDQAAAARRLRRSPSRASASPATPCRSPREKRARPALAGAVRQSELDIAAQERAGIAVRARHRSPPPSEPTPAMTATPSARHARKMREAARCRRATRAARSARRAHCAATPSTRAIAATIRPSAQRERCGRSARASRGRG